MNMKTKKDLYFRNSIRIIILFIIQLVTVSSYSQTNSDSSLTNRLNALISNQSKSQGISKEERELANSIHNFGDTAISELVKLLKYDDEQVRKRAAYTLSLFENIDRTYENDIIEALINGELWLAPNVAKSGSNIATQALVEALKKNTASHSILTNSFKYLGPKCIPYLVEIIDCQNNCDEDLLDAVSYILGTLDKDAILSVQALDSIAKNKENSIISRIWAIRCLGSIGPYAKEVDRDLLQIQKDEPDYFAKVVINALNEIKSPLVIDLMLHELDTIKSSFNKILILRDISVMGNNAYEAGSYIKKYLFDDDLDLRVASARTLGFIGYKPAIPELIQLLNFEPDWRLNYVSVLSLGKLKAKEALHELKKVEEIHWYSLVREVAKQTIISITDSIQTLEPDSNPYFAYDFFSYENVGEDIANCTIGKDNEQKQLIYLDGYLIGEDHGEWGGSLKYKDSSGNQIELINDNIKSINTIGENTVAIAGLAHLSFNKGIIYQITYRNNKIAIKEILVLPGAPRAIKKLKNHEIMITTFGGTVILSKDLKLRQATCREE